VRDEAEEDWGLLGFIVLGTLVVHSALSWWSEPLQKPLALIDHWLLEE
jgi:hypothetical protein